MPLACAAARPCAICAGVVHGLAQRQRAARQPLAQRLALEQLHHRVRRLAVAAEVVDREDAGVRERGDRLRLALEAGERLGGGREVRRQHLHRDVAVELRVARPVDLAHPAGAERGLDPIRPEPVAGREAHRADTMGETPGILAGSADSVESAAPWRCSP